MTSFFTKHKILIGLSVLFLISLLVSALIFFKGTSVFGIQKENLQKKQNQKKNRELTPEEIKWQEDVLSTAQRLNGEYKYQELATYISTQLSEKNPDFPQRGYLNTQLSKALVNRSLPGNGKEREADFLEAYRLAYENIQKSGDPFIRAAGRLSLSFIFLESCYNKDWYIQAAEKYDKKNWNISLEQGKNANSRMATILIHLRRHLSFAEERFGDRYLLADLAHLNTMLLEFNDRDASSEEDQKLAQKIISLVERSQDSSFILVSQTDSFVRGKALENELFSELVASLYLKKDTAELEKKMVEAIKTLTEDRGTSPGSYINEYHVRLYYAILLHQKYGKTKLSEIEKTLEPIIDTKQIQKAPGIVFAITNNQNTDNFLINNISLIAKDSSKLRSTLTTLGWKF